MKKTTSLAAKNALSEQRTAWGSIRKAGKKCDGGRTLACPFEQSLDDDKINQVTCYKSNRWTIRRMILEITSSVANPVRRFDYKWSVFVCQLRNVETYQANDERGCDDYVCKARGQEPCECRCVQSRLLCQVFENDNIDCVPNTAACLSPPPDDQNDRGGVFRGMNMPRETNARSTTRIGIQLLFVSSLILHAKNICIGVETATCSQYNLVNHLQCIRMLPTMTRGSSAARQCAVLVFFVNRRSHQKQTLCM